MACSLPDFDCLTPLTKIVVKNATRMSLNDRITLSRCQCYATFTAHWQRIDQPTDMIDTHNHTDDWRSTDPSTDMICTAFYLCIYVALCSAFYTHRHDVHSNTEMTYTGSDIHWQRIDQPTDMMYSSFSDFETENRK